MRYLFLSLIFLSLITGCAVLENVNDVNNQRPTTVEKSDRLFLLLPDGERYPLEQLTEAEAIITPSTNSSMASYLTASNPAGSSDSTIILPIRIPRNELPTTAYRNQGSRGTCTAFALAAMMETEIKVSENRDVDLSEEYIYALTKLQRPRFNGTPITVNDIDVEHVGDNSGANNGQMVDYFDHYDIAIPEERFQRYHQNFNYPQNVSYQSTQSTYLDNALRQTAPPFSATASNGAIPLSRNAQRNGAYYLSESVTFGIGQFTAEDIEAAIDNGRPVMASIRMCFDSIVNDSIMVSGTCGTRWGGHAATIIGFDISDPDNPYFILKNSWPGIRRRLLMSYDMVNDGANNQGVFKGISMVRVDDHIDKRISRNDAYLGRWSVSAGDLPQLGNGTLYLYRLASGRPLPASMQPANCNLFNASNDADCRNDYRLGTFIADDGQTIRINGQLMDDGLLALQYNSTFGADEPFDKVVGPQATLNIHPDTEIGIPQSFPPHPPRLYPYNYDRVRIGQGFSRQTWTDGGNELVRPTQTMFSASLFETIPVPGDGSIKIAALVMNLGYPAPEDVDLKIYSDSGELLFSGNLNEATQGQVEIVLPGSCAEQSSYRIEATDQRSDLSETLMFIPNCSN